MDFSRRSFLALLVALLFQCSRKDWLLPRAAENDEIPLGPGTFMTKSRVIYGPAWIFEIGSNAGGFLYSPMSLSLRWDRPGGNTILHWRQLPRVSFRWLAYVGGEIVVPKGGSVRFVAPKDMEIWTSYRREAWTAPVSAGTPGSYAEYERRAALCS